MDTVIQIIEVLAVIAASILVVIGYFIFQGYLYRHKRQWAELHFYEKKIEVLDAASANGASIKVHGEDFEIIQVPLHIPRTTTVSMESVAELPKLIVAPQVQIPVAPPYRTIAHLMTPDHIILTYTAQGPIYGEVSDLLSMALVGKPKRGKTTALLYYLCILLQAGAEVWIWDPHGEMHQLSYGLNYYDGLDDIAFKSVDLLHHELDARQMIYKTQNKRVKHPLVLLVDEMPVITDWERAQIKIRAQQKMREPMPSPYSVMKRFTLEARKWNCYVFISGQSLPADVLPTLTRDNLSSRLVLECSKDHARMIGLEKDAIDTLLPYLKGAERGTHIADFSSWSKPELADIPYTEIDDLQRIIDQRGNQGKRGNVWGWPVEPNGDIPYVHQSVNPRRYAQDESQHTVTGSLVTEMEQPVESFPDMGDIPKEERIQIVTIAKTHMSIYGKVKRNEIPSLMGKNNRYYSIVKQVLDEEKM
jgi:hypothetical protein